VTYELKEGIELGWDLATKKSSTAIEGSKEGGKAFDPMSQMSYAYPGGRQIS
jgi:hypothetical protein